MQISVVNDNVLLKKKKKNYEVVHLTPDLLWEQISFVTVPGY